jgi:hypothetical protein
VKSALAADRESLKAGDWLATSRLPYAPDGAPFVVIEPRMASDIGPQSTAATPSSS